MDLAVASGQHYVQSSTYAGLYQRFDRDLNKTIPEYTCIRGHRACLCLDWENAIALTHAEHQLHTPSTGSPVPLLAMEPGRL
jgi:hypothetical protein